MVRYNEKHTMNAVEIRGFARELKSLASLAETVASDMEECDLKELRPKHVKSGSLGIKRLQTFFGSLFDARVEAASVWIPKPLDDKSLVDKTVAHAEKIVDSKKPKASQKGSRRKPPKGG